MRLSNFLQHQWLNFRRSRNADKSLAFQIVIAIFYFLIFVEIAGLGIALPYLLKESFPAKDPVALFSSYILYYFLIGFLVRFQLQELPTLSIEPYLSQNIPRHSMIRFLNVRSLIHFLNFLPLFVFIPFTIVDIVPVYGSLVAIGFLMAMFALVINNHFLNMYVKRKSINSSAWLIGMALFILAIKGLDYLKILSFEKTSAGIFVFMLLHPLWCAVPVIIALVTFFINNQYLKAHLYLEELVKERKLVSGKNYSFLNKYGAIGELISLDLKMIFRNKRPKALIFSSIFFLLYGFILFPKNLQEGNYFMLFFSSQLITGIFIINYGQFLFAWQSSHFDGVMSHNIDIKQYLKAKFLLMTTVSALQFLIVCCYGFLGWRIIPIQMAAFIFNIGVNSFTIIYAATYNYKYLDIGKGASMNRQGSGGVQMLQALIIAVVPSLLFYLCNRFLGFWTSIIAISGLGIVGLIFRVQIIDRLTSQFYMRKHKILAGFRER